MERREHLPPHLATRLERESERSDSCARPVCCRLLEMFVVGFAFVGCDTAPATADELSGPQTRETRILPDPRNVQLGGDLGQAYDRGIAPEPAAV